jgi:RNA polymerase sigma factor (sigma-70 family)
MTDISVPDASIVEGTVDLAAAGDEAAFARLVGEHHASMARVAFVVSGDPETAADAVQAAWSIAWRRLHTLRDRRQVRAWLVAIAANEARQAIRRRRRAGSVIDISDTVDAADRDLSERLAVIDLERVLRELKPDERALLALRYVGGLDSPEIAAQLGISASGVRTRMSRLLERLRRDLEHD